MLSRSGYGPLVSLAIVAQSSSEPAGASAVVGGAGVATAAPCTPEATLAGVRRDACMPPDGGSGMCPDHPPGDIGCGGGGD
ncbi:MAG TPA: hypothetical protein VH143_14015 [Kofleriaceae bacterium]|jgi:hypothetical protein|nr:hypothetical protein [Kofleriaceae bacterium]